MTGERVEDLWQICLDGFAWDLLAELVQWGDNGWNRSVLLLFQYDVADNIPDAHLYGSSSFLYLRVPFGVKHLLLNFCLSQRSLTSSPPNHPSSTPTLSEAYIYYSSAPIQTTISMGEDLLTQASSPVIGAPVLKAHPFLLILYFPPPLSTTFCVASLRQEKASLAPIPAQQQRRCLSARAVVKNLNTWINFAGRISGKRRKGNWTHTVERRKKDEMYIFEKLGNSEWDDEKLGFSTSPRTLWLNTCFTD